MENAEGKREIEKWEGNRYRFSCICTKPRIQRKGVFPSESVARLRVRVHLVYEKRGIFKR
jgi:hypothetical protein